MDAKTRSPLFPSSYDEQLKAKLQEYSSITR